MTGLRRLREPAAVVALVVVVAQAGLNLAGLAVRAQTVPVTTLAGTTHLVAPLDAAVLTALVLACVAVAPVTARARALTLAAAVTTGTGAVAGLVLRSLALAGPGDGASRLVASTADLAAVAFQALFAWLLWGAHRAAAGRREPTVVDPAAGEAAGPGESVPAVPDGSAALPAPARPADAAAGAAWLRAGDAAAGAAASYGTWAAAPSWEVPSSAPPYADPPAQRPESEPPTPR